MTNVSVFSPNMPGEPDGMPGSVMPAIAGFSSRSFLTVFYRHVAVDDVGVALDEHRVAAFQILRERPPCG